MKLICIITLCIFSLVGESKGFGDYLNRFRVQSLPFKYDCNYMELFPRGRDWDKESIEELTVKNLICNSKNRDYLRKDNYYWYGVQYTSGGNYVCLVSKKKTEPGDTYYDNLLSSLIVITYDKTGKQISQAEIAKNSDMYFAKSYFLNDSIIQTVQTVNAIDPPKGEFDHVYVDMLEFKINKNGIITEKKLWVKRKGRVIMNTQKGKRTVEIRIDDEKW